MHHRNIFRYVNLNVLVADPSYTSVSTNVNLVGFRFKCVEAEFFGVHIFDQLFRSCADKLQVLLIEV